MNLYEAYRRICAYSCMYMPTPGTIDHFYPKSTRPDLSYEWSNYRLAHHRLNANKGASTAVLDPFTIQDGWFVLDFPSCLVRPGSNLPGQATEKIEETIRVLKLNDDDILVQERCDLMVSLARGDVALSFLSIRYPFLAKEIIRQGIQQQLHRIFKTL